MNTESFFFLVIFSRLFTTDFIRHKIRYKQLA
nr:MAG TPA: hypothetical protein [Caudoviricetes sp.]